MKSNGKQRAFVGVMAIVVQQGLWEGSRARAEEPVEWCGTYEAWVAEVGNQRGVAQGTCPIMGTCDTPSVRDAWMSAPLVTIRIKFHVICLDDGSNCAADQADIDAGGVALLGVPLL